MISKLRLPGQRKKTELLLKARVKELEQIICPGEVHDFKEVDRKFYFSGYNYHCKVRLVCQRCLKVEEEKLW